MTPKEYAIEIIKGRFHEAADVERFLPRPMSPDAAAYWPVYFYTQEDREGWTEDTKSDAADRWARSRKLTRSAISRHDECLLWSMTILKDERYRRILWRWAFCQAKGWNFGETCRRQGWAKTTAYRRLNASFERIGSHLVGERLFPTLPDEKYLEHLRPQNATESDKITAPSFEEVSQAIRFAPSFRVEESTDTLTTPAALAEFSKHLADVNEARRKARLRKTMRGVPGEASNNQI